MNRCSSMFYAETGSERLDFNNTGLRPNWDAFWALEYGDVDLDNVNKKSGPSIYTQFSEKFAHPPSRGSYRFSRTPSRSASGPIEHVRMVTGSEWIGEWDTYGMTGIGLFKMPYGVVYEGTMEKGLFDGVGMLRYPNGDSLEGLWYKGQLKYWRYDFADGLELGSQVWSYCTTHDRRFYSEMLNGLRPASKEQPSNTYPPREIPPGHYDVGLGFYNPKTKCVISATSGEVLSIPTVAEEKWILQKCRSAEPRETVGFCPDLYENWYKVDMGESEPKSVPKHSENKKEILSLMQQQGGELDHLGDRDPSLGRHSSSLEQSLEKFQLLFTRENNMPKIVDYDTLLKKVLKEMDNRRMKRVGKSSDAKSESDDDSEEITVIKLIKLINICSSKINKVIRDEKIGYPRKKTNTSEYSPLELFEVIGKFMDSNTSLKIAPVCTLNLESVSHKYQQLQEGANTDMLEREIESYLLKTVSDDTSMSIGSSIRSWWY